MVGCRLRGTVGLGDLPALSSVPESFTASGRFAPWVQDAARVLTFQSCLTEAVRGLRDSGESCSFGVPARCGRDSPASVRTAI